MTTGEQIKATETAYRGMYIYRLTNGTFGTSAYPVPADDLRDSRFVQYATEDVARAAIDDFILGDKG